MTPVKHASLWHEVALLLCTANAGTLVYVHGQGQVLTREKKAIGALIAGPSASTAFLTISLVDAKAGEILAYMRGDWIKCSNR
jgi:hypothetical protein